MSAIARYIVAGLAIGATNVSAIPPPGPHGYAAISTTLTVTGTGTISAAAIPTGSPASSVAILPTVSQPSPAPPADTAAAAAAAASNIALAKAAQADVTNVQRFNTLLTVNGTGKQLLPADELRQRTVFDFGAKAVASDGGRFVLANAANFPILVEQGISTAVGFLNACGMNSPHTHPRATEFLTVVQGKLETGFMLENTFLAGAEPGQLTTQVTSELSAFQGTVFPMGSIHFQFNPTCEPATFVATLNSQDPGTSQIAQNFFFLDEKIVNITLGDVSTIDGKNIDEFRKTLPKNLVQAVDACLSKCGK